MEVWKENKQTGLSCGINDFGELFLGNKGSGYNLPDTPENREYILNDFNYWINKPKRPDGPSTGTAPPVLMMAGQQRQHERPRFMGSGIGYQSPCKRYDRPEIACWGFGCSNSKERMCKYECWQETSGTAWEQNPRRNLQGTWDHQIFLCHV